MDGNSALVVEDDEPTRFAMRCMLDRCGFTAITEVSTAREALEVAEMIRPRVIVVDLALTGLLGLKVVPALHASYPGAAVYIVSAFARLREAARYAGAADMFDFEDPRILERQLHLLNPQPAQLCRCRPH